MNSLYGTEVFGYQIPSAGVAVAIGILIIGFFFVSRFDPPNPGSRGAVGRGRMHRCQRCGRDFQIEQVELLGNGEVRQWMDDHCPNCGWDLDWGSPNNPGGSSGRW